MFPSLLIKNVEPRVSALSKILSFLKTFCSPYFFQKIQKFKKFFNFIFYLSIFSRKQIKFTIGSIGDDTVRSGPLKTVSDGPDIELIIVLILGDSNCWLSLHRIAVVSEM